MDEATGFSTPTDIKWEGHTGVVEYGGGDRGQVAMFYNRAVHNPAKSLAQGRPIHEDQVYVRIHPPGERLNIIDRPATRSDSQRWPTQWNQFQQQKQQVPEGTQIDLLYPERPSVAAMLRAAAVHTIEQCAELSANAIETIGMGAQQYVNDAKKFLEFSNRGVKASQMRQELESRDREIKALKHMVTELQNTIDKMKDNNISGATLAQVQALIAGAQTRPEYLPGAQFDPQAATIAANHPTRQLAQQKPRRQRNRIV